MLHHHFFQLFSRRSQLAAAVDDGIELGRQRVALQQAVDCTGGVGVERFATLVLLDALLVSNRSANSRDHAASLVQPCRDIMLTVEILSPPRAMMAHAVHELALPAREHAAATVQLLSNVQWTSESSALPLQIEDALALEWSVACGWQLRECAAACEGCKLVSQGVEGEGRAMGKGEQIITKKRDAGLQEVTRECSALLFRCCA